MTTKLEYVRLIADALVCEYGSTLMDYGTDVRMARRVVDRLHNDLIFDPDTKETRAAFKEWEQSERESE